jgi:hypothetical protein
MLGLMNTVAQYVYLSMLHRVIEAMGSRELFTLVAPYWIQNRAMALS